MKWRYLKIGGGVIWVSNAISKETLVGRKTGLYDHIIDVQEGKYFDPDTNSWLEIEGNQ